MSIFRNFKFSVQSAPRIGYDGDMLIFKFRQTDTLNVPASRTQLNFSVEVTFSLILLLQNEICKFFFRPSKFPGDPFNILGIRRTLSANSSWDLKLVKVSWYLGHTLVQNLLCIIQKMTRIRHVPLQVV